MALLVPLLVTGRVIAWRGRHEMCTVQPQNVQQKLPMDIWVLCFCKINIKVDMHSK